MTRRTRNNLIWIFLLWVVFTAIGEGIVQAVIAHWPLIASQQGEVTGNAIFFLLRATTPVFTLVVLILVYSIIRFRVPDDDTAPAEAQYGSGWAFVLGWVSLSVALNILFIIYPGIYGLSELWGEARAATAKNPLEVHVTARQWEWDFKYPKYGLKDVDKLVVPVGRPIHFTLKSKDVIHSFWVPAWGLKKAVIPGETRSLVVTPNVKVDSRKNPYARVQCAQICGVGHPLMRGDLRVLSAKDFAHWVNVQQQKSKKSM